MPCFIETQFPIARLSAESYKGYQANSCNFARYGYRPDSPKNVR